MASPHPSLDAPLTPLGREKWAPEMEQGADGTGGGGGGAIPSATGFLCDFTGELGVKGPSGSFLRG